MFIIYLSDTPTREVKGEEYLDCPICKKSTLHRYEVVSFHASVMFVKVFCSRQRFIRICSQCGNGGDMTEEEFNRKVTGLFKSVKHPPKPKVVPLKKHQKISEQGITFCRECGQKIYPDIGYCTSCAVRKNSDSKKAAKDSVAPKMTVAKKEKKPSSVKNSPSPIKADRSKPEGAVSPPSPKPQKRPKKKVVSTLDPYGVKKK